ncbi:hypothetical protein SLE2022_145710 [Rubroshorea leprosula]
MGICCSCGLSTSSSAGNTAKLILEDDRLEEFSYPVKVSRILEKNSNSFICNSNDIDLDNILCAVDDDEELQPGELYFALPLSLLNSPLTAEDMGALAVRASLALNGSHGGGGQCFGCGCGMMRKMDSIVFNSRRVGLDGGGDESGGGDGRVVVDGRSELESLVKKKGKRGGRGRSFRSKLSAILEE